MRSPRLHAAILAALAALCVAAACSAEPSPAPTSTPTVALTPTPSLAPTPSLPAYEASGSTGGMVGDSASEFTGIAQWLNSNSLTMEELRGRVVLIDFWTYT